MPFDFSTQIELTFLRVTYASDRYRNGVSWRDTLTGSLFEMLDFISTFEGGEVIDIRPAPEPTTDFQFTDEFGFCYGFDELPGVLPEIAKSNKRDQKVDKVYGMTAETRRAHRSADKGKLEDRALAYANAMTGRSAECATVETEKVNIPGKKHPETRARCVVFSDGQEYHIPNWDFVDPGIMVGTTGA